MRIQVLYVFWLFAADLNYQQPEIRIPEVKIGLTDVWTISEAEKKYADTLRGLTSYPEEMKRGNNKCHLGRSEENKYPCLAKHELTEIDKDGKKTIHSYSLANDIDIFMPPFPFKLPSEFAPDESNSSWAPVQEAYEGPRILERLLELAQQGRVFDCEGYLCRVIVRSFDVKNQNTESLSDCSITLVQGHPGAPRNCRSFVLFAPDKTWVRVITSYGQSPPGYMLGRKDFNLAILAHFRIDTSLLREAVQKALASPPLNLLTEASQMGTMVLVNKREVLRPSYIIGTSERRESLIIPPYLEWVTVRVDLEEEETRKRKWAYFGLIVSTDLLLNLRPTQQEGEWHPPTQKENSELLRAITSNLKSALESLCTKFKWEDGQTLICENPKN